MALLQKFHILSVSIIIKWGYSRNCNILMSSPNQYQIPSQKDLLKLLSIHQNTMSYIFDFNFQGMDQHDFIRLTLFLLTQRVIVLYSTKFLYHLGCLFIFLFLSKHNRHDRYYMWHCFLFCFMIYHHMYLHIDIDDSLFR